MVGQMERSIQVRREEAAVRDAEAARRKADKKAHEDAEAERLHGYAKRQRRIFGGV